MDDPLVKARGSENTKWFHEEINKVLDTKGNKQLTPSTALDYLSIRISLSEEGDICLDNQTRIEATLAKA